MIYVAVYNNDASTLAQYAAVILDPSYTADLAVKSSTIPGDMRAFGVVMSPSISSHATGIVAFGRVKTSILVNGPVAFGHSLQIGPNAQRAQDAGGGGMIGAGSLGVALGTNVSGDATISVLLDPHPLFFTAAQVITQKYGGNDLSGSGTICGSVVNITPNQLLLFGVFDYSGGFTVPLWNGQTPAVLQAYSAGSVAYLGTLLGAGAATANFTGTFATAGGVGVAIALNGINQGGGAATFGTVAHNSYSASGAISITVACAPGDMVICTILISGSGTAPGISAENQTITEKAIGTGTAYEVMQAIATSTSITFNATIAGTGANLRCSMDGLALHTA
jgi:hypothetical protein